MDNGDEVHSIYTDFSKVFDTVNIEILLFKLRGLGFGGTTHRWFRSYLTDRKLSVTFNGHISHEFSPKSGVPQGSILGPMLFNIFINDLGSQLGCDHLFFADDLKIFNTISNQNDVRELSHDLLTLRKWCSENDIKLNADKCKSISFNNKNKPFPAQYFIGNQKLEKSQKSKT